MIYFTKYGGYKAIRKIGTIFFYTKTIYNLRRISNGFTIFVASLRI